MVFCLTQVLQEHSLEFETVCRFSLLFSSGCLCSSGLRWGMEAIVVDQRRGLDLNDDVENS